jgi:rod shape determining protein RodA
MWGLRIAVQAKDRFGAVLSFGVVAILFWHTIINIAMVLGLMPVVGIPLPLLSYGGSFLVSTLIGIGLLLNVSMRRYLF